MRGKGKRYPEEFKRQIIREVEETGNATLVSRRQTKVPGTVTRWVRESKKQNEQLKKLLGEKDLEIAILKDLFKKTNPY